MLLLCLIVGILGFSVVQGAVEVNQLPLQTRGAHFVDKQGNRVKLACLNWHGAHMNTYVVSGLHLKSSRDIARKVAEFGFNCIRLNWSVELVLNNPDVRDDVIAGMITEFDLTAPVKALTVMDTVVSHLAAEKILIILDNHISDARWCCDPSDQNGLWFNERWSVEQYELAWETIAKRYSNQPYVIAADLRNEIRPDIRFDNNRLTIKFPSWGTGNRILSVADFIKLLKFGLKAPFQDFLLTFLEEIFKRFGLKNMEFFDWKEEVERVSQKIHSVNPNLIIIVQGLFDMNSFQPSLLDFLFNRFTKISELRTIMEFVSLPAEISSYRQIQNLTGVIQSPPNIPSDRLAYTAHIYPFFYQESNFKFDGTTPTYESFKSELDFYWGDIAKNKIAPLWVGELGVSRTNLDGAWKDYIIRYVKELGLDFSYWPLGSGRPEIDENGTFMVGEDEYSLFDSSYDHPAHVPHYEILKELL